MKRLQEGLRRKRVVVSGARKEFLHIAARSTRAIEDGLKVWAGGEDVESITVLPQFLIESRHVSRVSEENARLNCVC